MGDETPRGPRDTNRSKRYQKVQEVSKGPRGTKRSKRYRKVQEVPKGPGITTNVTEQEQEQEQEQEEQDKLGFYLDVTLKGLPRILKRG